MEHGILCLFAGIQIEFTSSVYVSLNNIFKPMNNVTQIIISDYYTAIVSEVLPTVLVNNTVYTYNLNGKFKRKFAH